MTAYALGTTLAWINADSDGKPIRYGSGVVRLSGPGGREVDAQAASGAALIAAKFADYNARFREITARARLRFTTREWGLARDDARERIALYDRAVGEATAAVRALLGATAIDRALWSALKCAYADTIAPLLDQELNKTFFNTLTRRVFKTRGVDPDIEFIALDIEPTDRITHPVARLAYAVHDNLAVTLARALGDADIGVAFADRAGCAARVTAALERQLGDFSPVVAIELLVTTFYRERRAYLVGRVFGEQRLAPLVIALIHADDGARADAVITDPEQVAQVFGFTRAYFHADLETVGDAVVFLRTLLPRKPVDELYTVLGRAKQGKTERYRHLFRHLAASGNEPLVHADGVRGLVMAVFTLPSYPVVFKVIRDRFGAGKTMQRGDVLAKYRLVFEHDRVGRLVDAQEFKFLRFPRRRFAAALLDELLDSCAASVVPDGDDLVVRHCYIERRLRPLDLYLREVDSDAVRRAIVDYGQAIKDLARSNIFAGDLLLKNFGMTRHGRAIFYDYDELQFVTDCRFRALPEARDDDEAWSDTPWFHVADSDVFPAEFPRFLGLSHALKAALLEAHGELFDHVWWQRVQTRIARGDYADLPPYPERMRLT